MADGTKKLFKKLRTMRRVDRPQENTSENPQDNSIPIPPTNPEAIANPPQAKPPEKQPQNTRSASSKVQGRRSSFIDPLDYFNKEHLFIKPGNMDEYIVKVEEKKVEAPGKEKEPKRKRTVGAPVGGGAGGAGGDDKNRITLEDMLKARQSLRNSTIVKDTKKPMSVGSRKNNKEEAKGPEDKKKSAQYEKNLYIKLVLARNKYSQRSKTSTVNIYQEILTKIDELKAIKDMPPNLADEIDDMNAKLDLNEGLIVDEDVQTVLSDEDDSDPVGINIVPLKDVIKKIKPEAVTN